MDDLLMLIGRGYEVTIDGVKIGRISSDSPPLPDMHTKLAQLVYLFDSDDVGQQLIDKYYYEGDKANHVFCVSLPAAGLKLEYEATFAKYELINLPVIKIKVLLKLNGDFKYSRGMDNPLFIERHLAEE